MPKSKAVETILSEAEQIARVWAENTDFALSGVTLKQFQAMIADLRAQSDKTEDLRTQLTASSNDTNTKAVTLSDILVRARGGIRAFYGPDSNQYEQVGGTLKRDRKRPTRKTKPGGASS